MSLEPVNAQELPSINRWWAVPEVIRFWAGVGVPSLAETEAWYERSARSPDQVIWSIRVQGQTVGHCFLSIDWNNRGGTSGMLIGELDAWGRGYAREVVLLRTRYAFEGLGLERLESESIAGNSAMHRALERAGYRAIGTKHHAMFREGRWLDAYIFELTREDWEARVRYTTGRTTP